MSVDLSRRLAVSVALIAALGVAALLQTHHTSSAHHSPATAAAVGRSLTPLAVYLRVGEQSGTGAAAPGQRVVSDPNHPGTADIIGRRPAVMLHVQYATVREISSTLVGRTQWEIELFAPEGATFTNNSAGNASFVAVVDDRALPLLFDVGSADKSNFAFMAGTDEGQAIAIAQQLTTSVRIQSPSS